MGNPWADEAPYEYIWLLELHKTKRLYHLRGMKNPGFFPGGRLTKCEKQTLWSELWENRSKEHCDMRLLLRDGSKEWVHSKVVTPLSKFMKGAMRTVQKGPVIFDCSNSSSSSIRALVAWAYVGQLVFNKSELVDVFNAASYLGFELLYARLIKAAFEDPEDLVERVDAEKEIVKITDKKIKRKLLNILKDQTYTQVPQDYYEDYFD